MSHDSPRPVGAVDRVPAAEPEAAVAHFYCRFRFEADVSDVHSDLEHGTAAFTLVDTRGQDAWDQGHIPAAIHLPTDDIPVRAADLIEPGHLVVTYCWGPGCNGATRAALAFARLGYQVKEMIGGYEYWVREGFAVTGADGREVGSPDPLTAVGAAGACDC